MILRANKALALVISPSRTSGGWRAVKERRQVSLCANSSNFTRRVLLRQPLIVGRTFSTAVASADLAPFASHKLNVSQAIMKVHECDYFNDLVKPETDVSVLQGIGPVHREALESLRIRSLQDLANYKFFGLARAIQTLAKTEEENGRLEGAKMNLNRGVDKSYESSSLQEILQAPVDALLGLSTGAGKTWQKFGVVTVDDLANCKYFHWAESLIAVAKFEEVNE